MASFILTAFEPFAGDGRNPSAEVLSAIAANPPVQGLITEILPVTYVDAGRRIEQLIAEHRPTAWIGLGLHAGATAITLERRAANWDEATLADNGGEVRLGSVIHPDGPEFRSATLPWDAVAAGTPVVFSDSAGRFVCNHTFYRAAAAAEQLSPTTGVGFVHLPWPSDWPERGGRRAEHAVRFTDLVAGVRACLEVVARSELRTLAL